MKAARQRAPLAIRDPARFDGPRSLPGPDRPDLEVAPVEPDHPPGADALLVRLLLELLEREPESLRREDAASQLRERVLKARGGDAGRGGLRAQRRDPLDEPVQRRARPAAQRPEDVPLLAAGAHPHARPDPQALVRLRIARRVHLGEAGVEQVPHEDEQRAVREAELDPVVQDTDAVGPDVQRAVRHGVLLPAGVDEEVGRDLPGLEGLSEDVPQRRGGGRRPECDERQEKGAEERQPGDHGPDCATAPIRIDGLCPRP